MAHVGHKDDEPLQFALVFILTFGLLLVIYFIHDRHTTPTIPKLIHYYLLLVPSMDLFIYYDPCFVTSLTVNHRHP